MLQQPPVGPDCESDFDSVNRRQFMKTAGVAAVATAALPAGIVRAAEEKSAEKKASPESLVAKLYGTMSDAQKKELAFDWDFADNRGLLRTRDSNNWHITKPTIGSDYFTKDQQEMLRAIYEGLFNSEWVPKIDKQLKDDGGGYGKSQNIAMFGKPGDGKFEMVMTGRHMTVRVDGNSVDHMAFGGPIFHGHAASKFDEAADHPGNIWWPQAVEANKVFEMLDGKQRKVALLPRTPAESAVSFRGPDAQFPGVQVAECTSDQKVQLEKTLALMLAPYRDADREEAMNCLKKQGGLEKCGLAFYQSGDLGDDGVWDNWRLEGPSFVWYFRGAPHVHLWINIADNHEVKTNAQG